MPRGGIRKTHKQFMRELEIKNPFVFNNYEILNEYIDCRIKIRLKNKYGIVESLSTSLLNGSIPTIQSAVDKTKYFINQMKEINGDKYDYSLTKYINARKRIKVICPKHGIFTPVAGEHLRGKQCSLCSNENHGKLLSKDTEYFINRSVKTHGDLYDYSLVDYINNITSVKIICPIHGVFNQKAGNHMSGQGCPYCEGAYYSINGLKSHGVDWLKIKSYLYIAKLKNGNEEFYKVGISKNPNNRFKNFKPYKVMNYNVIKDSLYNIVVLENYIHEKLSKVSYNPMHHFAGHTECFNYIDDNIIEFCYSTLNERMNLIKGGIIYK